MFKNLFKKSENNKTQPEPIYPNGEEYAEVVKMPKMSESMKYGKVSKWHVKEGDYVQSGDVLADVETDKATMELETYEAGMVLYLEKKEKISVDGLMMIIGGPKADVQQLLEMDTKRTNHNQSDNYSYDSGIVGEIKLFAGSEIPENWLLCNGEFFNTKDKPELFAVIGYRFGGSRHIFQVPKMKGVDKANYIICQR